MYRYLPLLCALVLCVVPGLRAQELKMRVVATNLGVPWEILWGPDNQIWMTERQGKVSRLNPETGDVATIATIPEVDDGGEAGLLGMALHPDFPTVPQVFLAYTYKEGPSRKVRVSRYIYQGTTLTDPFTVVEGIQGAGIHDGCRLLFAPDKTLLITTGDAADQSLPQKHSSLNGKVLRLNTDGTIPADNPWPGSALFSTGHRNPQGLTFGPQGKLYSSEHGPDEDDEVNIIQPGRNFGWPNIHGYCDKPQEKQFCEDSSVVEPIAAWTPTLAVCGMEYYNQNAIFEWKNSLLLTTLKASRLVQLKLSADGSSVVETKEFLVNKYGRLRDVCVAPDGRVFISTSNADNNDKVIEIKLEAPPAPLIASADTLDFGRRLRLQNDTTLSVAFINIGDKPIAIASNEYTISGEDASDFSITNMPGAVQLQPNQQLEISVRFSPISAGSKSAMLTVKGIADGNNVEKSVALLGIKSMKNVTGPLVVNLGTVIVGESTEATIATGNNGLENITLMSLSTDAPFSVIAPANLPTTLVPSSILNVRVAAQPTQPGRYEKILTATFEDGIQLQTTLIVVATTASTGIDDVEQPVAGLKAMPTPAATGVELRLSAPQRGTALWSIVDMNGRIVFTKETTADGISTALFWNGRTNSGATCPTGRYTAIVVIGEQRYTAPLVLTH